MIFIKFYFKFINECGSSDVRGKIEIKLRNFEFASVKSFIALNMSISDILLCIFYVYIAMIYC